MILPSLTRIEPSAAYTGSAIQRHFAGPGRACRVGGRQVASPGLSGVEAKHTWNCTPSPSGWWRASPGSTPPGDFSFSESSSVRGRRARSFGLGAKCQLPCWARTGLRRARRNADLPLNASFGGRSMHGFRPARGVRLNRCSLISAFHATGSRVRALCPNNRPIGDHTCTAQSPFPRWPSSLCWPAASLNETSSAEPLAPALAASQGKSSQTVNAQKVPSSAAAQQSSADAFDTAGVAASAARQSNTTTRAARFHHRAALSFAIDTIRTGGLPDLWGTHV